MATTDTDNVPAEGNSVPAEGNSGASPSKMEQLRAVAKLIKSGGAKPIAAYYFAQWKTKAATALAPRLIPVIVKVQALRQRFRGPAGQTPPVSTAPAAGSPSAPATESAPAADEK